MLANMINPLLTESEFPDPAFLLHETATMICITKKYKPDSLGIINPKEITVQHRLHHPRNPGDLIHIPLPKIPPQPIGNVQRPVQAQREQIVRRDRLGLARALQHEQLRQDGHALQPDAERPQHLGDLVAVGEEDAQDGGGEEQVLDLERVDVGVVGRAVVGQHQVEGVGLGGEEEEFEGGVVEGAGREGPEDVCGGRRKSAVSCGFGESKRWKQLGGKGAFF